MNLFVVTGMSGAGKSKAVNFLEDLGYYCLDNLPVKLLSSVVGWMEGNKDFSQKVAVTLDIRSRDISDSFFSALEAGKRRGVPVRVLFLDCEGWCKEHGKTVEQLLEAGWDVGVAWQDGRPFHRPYAIRLNLAVPFCMLEDAIARLDKYVFGA